MADPYSRYGSTVVEGNVSRPAFPGYSPSPAPSLASHFGPSSADMQGASSSVLNEDINSWQPVGYGLGGIPSAGVHSDPSGGVSASASIRGYSPFEHKLQPGGYGLGGIPSTGGHPEPSLAGLSAAASIRVYSPLEGPNLVGHRKDASAGINPDLPDLTNERPSSVKNVDGPSDAGGQSNTLFVDGLPTDCTRREVGHIFRPFVGYKDIKVVHKEPRRSGDRAMVFCIVEFIDSKCALTAMDALQGYKFDDKKPESAVLRIQFAHFPLRL